MKSSEWASKGDALKHHFIPLILDGFQEMGEQCNFEHGAFYMDLHVNQAKALEELAKKGCPKVLVDFALNELVLND